MHFKFAYGFCDDVEVQNLFDNTHHYFRSAYGSVVALKSCCEWAGERQGIEIEIGLN